MAQAEVPYRKGFDYGIGVELAGADPRGRGVAGERSPVEGAGGGGGTFDLQKIETTEDLEESLGISAEASGGVGLFSASGRFDFAKKCKVRSTSLVLLLSATEQFGFEQIDEPTLTPEAAKLVEDGDLALFLERYGDSFVRGVETGGQFFGVIRIDTESSETRKQIDAALEGAYGTFSAEAKTTLTEALQQHKTSVETRVFWEGGRVTAEPTSPEQLIAAASEWRDRVPELAVPYRVTLAPYTIASGPKPPNAADLQHQRDVLKRCARLRSQSIDDLNLLDYMADPDHADEFEAKPEIDVAALRAGVARDLDVIAEAASYALNHPKEAREPETYAREVMSPPDPSYTRTVLPAGMPKHLGPQANQDAGGNGDASDLARFDTDVDRAPFIHPDN